MLELGLFLRPQLLRVDCEKQPSVMLYPDFKWAGDTLCYRSQSTAYQAERFMVLRYFFGRLPMPAVDHWKNCRPTLGHLNGPPPKPSPGRLRNYQVCFVRCRFAGQPCLDRLP